MPLKHFICPDSSKIKVSQCLKEGGCRVGNRCATRSYLQLVSAERPWTGKPSTTQLIQGTMQAFLRITKDYSISPDKRAFMIHGTKGHGNLEHAKDSQSALEISFKGDDVEETGISDVIECELGRIIMSDYKTSGSYKVAKALGFVVEKEDTGEVYKTGPRKGQPKLRNILVRKDEAIDRWEWELQLNKYRIEAEKKIVEILAKKKIKVPHGKKIDELRIQVIVRDGNTYIARSRGVFRNVYYFKLPILPNRQVLEYFAKKRLALQYALEKGKWSRWCSEKENWDGLKCKSYCEVAEYCPLGQMFKEDKKEEEMAIKGVSDIRRLPRVGKIRLGIKVKKIGDKWVESEDGTLPREIDYFKFDPATPIELENKRILEEVKKLYGEKPKQIKIMFPIGDVAISFPQWWKRYGQSTALKCKGDGEFAYVMQKEFAKDLEIVEEGADGRIKVKCLGKECPYVNCAKPQCGMSGTLQVLVPEIPGAGVWQINTGSFNSIVNLNGCIEYVKAVCGRFHMIPLTLERREQTITHDGKARKHHVLHINMDIRLKDLQNYALIAPEKIMLELPAPEADKKDVLFLKHENIETVEAETIEVKEGPLDTAKLDAQFKKSTEVATEISEKMAKVKTVAEVNKLLMDAQKNKDLMQEHKEWLNDEATGNRIRLKQ